MHETMIAQSIFETILTHAKEYNTTVVSAKISCGQFNPINDEVLNFAFEMIAKGSPCEGMTLEIEHIPLKATCKKCSHVFDFDVYNPLCTKCDSCEFDFTEDAPLLLEEIELKDPDQARPEPKRRT